MFLKRLGAGLLVLALTACSTYRGPLPDYSYVGTAADAEIQKFTFKEGYFSQGAGAFAMGPNQQPYSLKSLRPVIQNVSPRAWNTAETAQVWNRVGQVAVVAALAILLTELSNNDDHNSTDQALGYWSLLGLSFGAGVTRTVYMNRAAREYNQDLRSKFSPTLGMNFSF